MTENHFSQPEPAPVHPDVSSGETSVNEGLETLRQLAQLPPPHGLEEGVYERLSKELAAMGAPKQRGFWSLWKPVHRLQYAGAALLMVVIGVTSWTVLRERPSSLPGTPVQPVAPVLPASNFGSAGAERRPTAVKPIKVPPAPKKKPGAGRVAKPSPKSETSASQ